MNLSIYLLLGTTALISLLKLGSKLRTRRHPARAMDKSTQYWLQKEWREGDKLR